VVGERGVVEALRSDATPLVGRGEELDLLLRRWQQAKAGEGRVVLISGEPGIGKSRLTAALSEGIESDPHTRVRYFCSPHHQDSALYPFIVQLERAAGFTREDTADERLGKLRGLLALGVRSAAEIDLLAELLSLPSTASDLNLSPQRKREMLFEALLHQLEALAQSRAVLMIFEDAHWVDPTSRELLDLTVNLVRRLPILLVITFRPEFQQAWSGQPDVTVLALNRLGGRDSARLVEQLAGNTGISRTTLDEIVERTDGVPLFVEELTKAVLESGEHDNQVAAVLAASPLPELAIPATLHASLIARLDRLGPIAREVGQIGAVLGREFGYDLIEEVAGRPPEELRLGLDRLAEAGLLFCHGTAPQSSYLFKHALVQDAAYGTLLRSRRQELHARIGKVLTDKFPETVDTQPEILAHHFTQAGLVEPAIEFSRRAGVRSIDRSAHAEAAGHFERALNLLEKLVPSQQRDERELELTLALAVPLIAVHGFGSLRVETRAMRAKKLSDKLPRSSRRFAAQRVAWNSCLMRQPLPNTVALARQLIELAERDNDLPKLAVARRALGYSLFIAGELRAAVELLEGGIALADALSDREFAIYGEHPGMVCRIYAGQAKILMGYPETGGRLIEAAIARARQERNAHSLAWALAVAAHSSATQNETQMTDRFASEAIDTAREHRLPQWLALGERCKGWAIHRLGDFAAGLDLQQLGVRRWYETGAMLHATHCEIYLAESLLGQGQTEAARSHLAAACTHRDKYGEAYLDAEIDRVESSLLEREGVSAARIEQKLHNAMRVARIQGARLLELRAATSLAWLWGEQTRRAEARELLAPLYGWFTEGFDTQDLKEAKTLLDELR
jgi:AAA ATPase domain